MKAWSAHFVIGLVVAVVAVYFATARSTSEQDRLGARTTSGGDGGGRSEAARVPNPAARPSDPEVGLEARPEAPPPDPRTPRLVGRVVDDEAHGVPDVEVVLRSQLRDGTPREVRTRTDDEGRYEIRSTALGRRAADRLYLDLQAAGFAPCRDDLLGLVQEGVPPGGPARHDVVLDRGRRVSGRVVKHPGGEPFRGVAVELLRFEGRGVDLGVNEDGVTMIRPAPFGPTRLATTHTDDRGWFSLPCVPSGTGPTGLFFNGEPWGAVAVRPHGWAAGAVLIPWGEEDLAEIELRVLPGIRINGRVLDVDESPVSGALVSLNVDDAELIFLQRLGANVAFEYNPGAGGGWRFLYVVTGADGRFAMPPVPRGMLASLSICRPAGDPRGGGWDQQIALPDRPRLDLGVLRLRSRGDAITLDLHARDEDGNGVSAASLVLDGRAHGRTDSHGRLRVLLPLETERVGIEVRRRGHVPAFLEVDPREPVVVDMPPARDLTGRVLFADGEPAVHATVTVYPTRTRLGWLFGKHDLGLVETETDHAGMWCLEDLPDEPVIVTASWSLRKHGRRHKRWDLDALPEGDLVLQFDERRPATGGVVLSFEDAEGRTMEVLGSLRGDGGDSLAFLGALEIDDLPVGTYDVRAGTEGCPPLEARLEIVDGRVTRRTFRFEPGCPCRIVIDAGSEATFAVLARREDGRTRSTLLGRGEADDDLILAPGRWHFAAVLLEDEFRTPVTDRVTLEIIPGELATIRLKVVPLAWATVAFGAGVEVDGAEWRLEIGEGTERYSRPLWLREPGYELQVVPAGRRRWRITGPKGTVYDDMVDVAEGATHTIVIE